MENEVSSGFRIATGIIVMMFVISIGLTIMMIGRAFFNDSTNAVEAPLNSLADTDLYYMAAYGDQGTNSTSGYGKPIPVSNLMKWMINPTNAGNVQRCYIYTRNASNPATWTCAYMYEKGYAVPTIDARTCLEPFMAEKAFISWERNDATALYEMEVYID